MTINTIAVVWLVLVAVLLATHWRDRRERRRQARRDAFYRAMER